MPEVGADADFERIEDAGAGESVYLSAVAIGEPRRGATLIRVPFGQRRLRRHS